MCAYSHIRVLTDELLLKQFNRLQKKLVAQKANIWINTLLCNAPVTPVIKSWIARWLYFSEFVTAKISRKGAYLTLCRILQNYRFFHIFNSNYKSFFFCLIKVLNFCTKYNFLVVSIWYTAQSLALSNSTENWEKLLWLHPFNGLDTLPCLLFKFWN